MVPEQLYEESRRMWDLRYGGYIKERNLWRITAMIAVIVALIAVVGVVYVGSQSKYIPFIVEVDKLGKASAVKPARRISSVDERVIVSRLAEFTTYFRSVSVDINSQNTNLEKLYSSLNRQDPAFEKITTYMKGDGSPFVRAEGVVVSVEIKNVLSVTEKSWRIEWIETIRKRNGELVAKEEYQAIANIIIIPSSMDNDKFLTMNNPLGIYVRDITWQKELN